LYTKRRIDPANPGIPFRDFEKLVGRPREHLEFSIWFLAQKRLIVTDDNSRLNITVEGVEYLESSYSSNLTQKRLPA
jgi:hypothetical protein